MQQIKIVLPRITNNLLEIGAINFFNQVNQLGKFMRHYFNMLNLLNISKFIIFLVFCPHDKMEEEPNIQSNQRKPIH